VKEIYMRNRSRTDIICKILKLANGGIKTRTKIMYQAFLSYAQLREYLTILTENNLLSYDVDTQTFRTTEKGLKFLNTYTLMDSMIKAPSSSSSSSSAAAATSAATSPLLMQKQE
jgi:predicted transcriptional regulator